MTPDKGSLNNFERFNKPIEIKVADKSALYSYGKGNVNMIAYDGNEKIAILLKEFSMYRRPTHIFVFAINDCKGGPSRIHWSIM